MNIVGYTSERLAAGFCVDCAAKKWTPEELMRGEEIIHHTHSSHRYNLRPVFSTDKHNLTCDDCFETLPYANEELDK